MKIVKESANFCPNEGRLDGQMVFAGQKLTPELRR